MQGQLLVSQDLISRRSDYTGHEITGPGEMHQRTVTALSYNDMQHADHTNS